VFINGEPAKKHYRKFNIKTVDGSDDFASLQETLTRRIDEFDKAKDISFSSKPNLLVIDGGKGQLSSVCEVLEQKNINWEICSLAERDEEIFLPGHSESIKLKKSDVALQVLQRLRDEAHRFAITFHKKKREKQQIKRILDDVKGVGKVKKMQLFEKFGTIENILNATVKELMLIKGLTETEALEIKKLKKD
ncbi:MAG: excinuclease ABC subunit C, partial [Clostridia bacterium]|nr:excinuclease ABC subunit C [Clostridia bacterium]